MADAASDLKLLINIAGLSDVTLSEFFPKYFLDWLAILIFKATEAENWQKYRVVAKPRATAILIKSKSSSCQTWLCIRLTWGALKILYTQATTKLIKSESMGKTMVFVSELFNVKIPKGEACYLFLIAAI